MDGGGEDPHFSLHALRRHPGQGGVGGQGRDGGREIGADLQHAPEPGGKHDHGGRGFDPAHARDGGDRRDFHRTAASDRVFPGAAPAGETGELAGKVNEWISEANMASIRFASLCL